MSFSDMMDKVYDKYGFLAVLLVIITSAVLFLGAVILWIALSLLYIWPFCLPFLLAGCFVWGALSE